MFDEIKRITKNTYYRYTNRKSHLKIGKKAAIAGLQCIFEGENSIGEYSKFKGKMGYGSYIRKHCNLINVSIGRFCSIGDNVSVALGKHPTSIFVSTHPAFYSTVNEITVSFVNETKFEEHDYVNQTTYSVVIENDVWIGNGVQIREGVKIGNGSVIAMGAVVVEDVGPFTIMGGVPAKIIGHRFDESEREALMKIKWWNKDIDWIKSHANSFDNVSDFINIK